MNKIILLLGLVVLFSSFAYGAVDDDLNEGILAYFAFDGDYTDSTGNETMTNHGTSLDTGIINQSVDFVAASTEYTTLSNIDNVDTFAMWFKTDVAITSSNYAAMASPDSGTSAKALFIGDPTAACDNAMVAYIVSNPQTYCWNETDVGFTSYLTDAWYHMVITWDSSESNYRLFINGSDKGLAYEANTPSQLSTWTGGDIGRRNDGIYFDGEIDELGFWDFELESSHVSYLYNSGSPGTNQQYTFGGGAPAPSSPNGTVSLNRSYSITQDAYTYSKIGFLNYDDEDYILNRDLGGLNGAYTTYYTFPVYDIGNTNLQEAYIYAYEYSEVGYTYEDLEVYIVGDWNHTNITYSNRPAEIIQVDDADIGPVNDIDPDLFRINITSAYLYALNNDLDTLNLKLFDTMGFTESTYTSYRYNHTSYASYINVTYWGPAMGVTLDYPVNNSAYYGNWNGSITLQTNKTASCYLNDSRFTLQGSQGVQEFVFLNNTVITDETVNFSYNCTDGLGQWVGGTGFWFTKYNVLNVTLYNDLNGALISGENISLEIYDDTYYNNSFWTTNGTMQIIGLDPGNYTAKFESSTYVTQTQPFSQGYGEYSELDIYLTDANYSVIFTMKDRNNQNILIEGATVTIQKYVLGTLQTVGVKQSDSTGSILFYYAPDTYHSFYITASGYEAKNFTLDPIILSAYSVLMTPTTTPQDLGFLDVSFNINPSYYLEGNNSITTSLSDANGSLQYYWINISYPGGVNDLYGTTLTGETFNTWINITGAGFGDVVNVTMQYKKVLGDVHTFNYAYEVVVNQTNGTIIGNRGKDYGLGIIERLFIVTGLAVLFGGALTYFGSPTIGAFGGLIVFGLMIYQGFIGIYAAVIPILLLLLYLMWGGR